MGNSVTKKFDVPKEHTATAGHLQLWKIWPGKSKDASGTPVSIWTFDKSELAKKKAPSGVTPYTDKAVVEQIYQISMLAVLQHKVPAPDICTHGQDGQLPIWLSLYACRGGLLHDCRQVSSSNC
ncbi:hypothetical protein EON65_04945 [archaeon]|nr:MAG: hypothetical protein EON65_04945 [archaeon]